MKNIKEKHYLSDYYRVPGIYFLYKDDKIVYIGESACIYSRITQHHKKKDFDYFKYRVCNSTKVNRKRTEEAWIRKLKPALNKIYKY